MDETGRLDGRTVVVTGAGSGIGRAACQAAVSSGARVVAVDLDGEAVRATAETVEASTVVGSVADPATWAEVISTTEALGGLDVVYLNAGVYGHVGPIDELPIDLYERTIAANITGVVMGVRCCVPTLRARGGGALVATASVAGIVAFPPNALYTLTKQAVTGFVRAMAPNLLGDGITFDAVCPGVVDTPMTVEALQGAPADAFGFDLIAPERIAEVALGLAADEGTGRCVAVLPGIEPVEWAFPDWSDLVTAAMPPRS